MDTLVEELNTKLARSNPRISSQVRSLVAEIIARADKDALNSGRSRAAEQEVLNLLDHAPASR